MRRNRNSRMRVNQTYGNRSASRRATRQQASAHQHRGDGLAVGRHFDAPEVWHEPRQDGMLRIVVEPAGTNYIHAVKPAEIRERVAALPAEFQERLDVVQLSRMTRKRRLFPCYGLQWGTAVYLYPIEESLEELYVRPPRPAQRIETQMYGGRWVQDGAFWRLIWTESTVRDYVLNNVLIHEIGHINDDRNTSFRKRERFADWFAVEYGYRASRSSGMR